MPTYLYKARNREGKIVTGNITAASFRMSHREIVKQNLEPIALRIKPRFFEGLIPGGVKVKDRALFYRQMATMLKAGVSIIRALEVCKKSENKYLRKIVNELKQALEEGFPFSFSLAAYPKVFPTVDVGVIKAGEVTANLEKVLKDLAIESAHAASFASRIKGVMLYPAFIFVTLIVIGVIVLIKVIPPIQLIFEEAKVPLPFMTQVLIAGSQFMIQKWWLLLIILVVLAILIRLIWMTQFAKLRLSRLMIKLPIFGRLTQDIFLARFSRTLNFLLKAGVPISQSIRIVKGITSNLIYQKVLEKAASSLEQGFSLSKILEESGYFPAMVVHLILTGEQTGDLGGVLTTISEYYEEEVDVKLKNFSTMIEPIIIVIMGIAVGVFILSILTPIYSIVQIS